MGNGKLVWHGMSEADAFNAVVGSGRYEYIASGNSWFWVRYKKDPSDVIEVRSENGVVVDVDFVG